MAYIIFVQPAVLLANYPIAVAPAMGHNFFVVYSVVIGTKTSWRLVRCLFFLW